MRSLQKRFSFYMYLTHNIKKYIYIFICIVLQSPMLKITAKKKMRGEKSSTQHGKEKPAPPKREREKSNTTATKEQGKTAPPQRWKRKQHHTKKTAFRTPVGWCCLLHPSLVRYCRFPPLCWRCGRSSSCLWVVLLSRLRSCWCCSLLSTCWVVLLSSLLSWSGVAILLPSL